MAFENCKLEEEEQREYIIPYTNEKVEFGGGTIDRKNNIRLYMYANGPIMEPSDEFSFIFDYKGTVMYPTLRRELIGDDVSWYLIVPDGVDSDETILDAFREAMRVYKHVGYKSFLTTCWNEKGIVNIKF